MDNLEHYRMKIGMYIHEIRSRRNCSKSGSKSCRFHRKIIILLWLVISVLWWSLANDSGIEKNLGPTFIQLKSNEESLFLDMKKINNKIIAAASYRFFLYTCIEQNLIPQGYRLKMSVYTSSLSQLLHEEHSKHIMEVALKNMKTDLKHYNKLSQNYKSVRVNFIMNFVKVCHLRNTRKLIIYYKSVFLKI